MGTIKTTNIETITGSGTLTLGQSGETISVPSGATLDLSNATQTGVGGTNTPAFFVYKNTSQTLNDETDTKVTWTTERFDTHNAFSSDKFTVPSGQAGKYFFAFHSHVYDYNEELRQINRAFRKNGGYTGSVDNTFDTAVVVTNNVPITTIIDLSVGDYIETYVWGNTADNGTFEIYGEGLNYTYFYGYKLI